jgi:hypothetical protein
MGICGSFASGLGQKRKIPCIFPVHGELLIKRRLEFETGPCNVNSTHSFPNPLELAVPSRRLEQVYSGSMPDEPGGRCSNPETLPTSLPDRARFRKECDLNIPAESCQRAVR